jgi:hypothetical protein
MSLRPCGPNDQHINRQRHSLVLDDACIASTLAPSNVTAIVIKKHLSAIIIEHHRAPCADLSILGLIENTISFFFFVCFLIRILEICEVLVPFCQPSIPSRSFACTLIVL